VSARISARVAARLTGAGSSPTQGASCTSTSSTPVTLAGEIEEAEHTAPDLLTAVRLVLAPDKPPQRAAGHVACLPAEEAR
jgi:hypothetical protein